MEDKQGGGNKKIYIAIIALLLLINGVALYLLYSENKEKQLVETQKAALKSDFDKLNVTLDENKAELEQYKGKNAELDSQIVAKQEEIDQQKRTIAGLFAKGKMNGKELEEAKAKIAQFEASIADFQKKVDELTQQNQQLSNQNQQLNTDLNAEKQTTTNLTEQNKGLSKKVELGSLLHLQNIEVVGVTGKKNKKGEDITINKGKKTAQLRVSFETGENKVLEPGALSLYVRIINPKGETVAVADQGSGNFKAAETGETVQYTKQADFQWDQSNKKIVVYWSSNVTDAGTYKVEVYQSGYLVGKGEVTQK